MRSEPGPASGKVRQERGRVVSGVTSRTMGSDAGLPLPTRLLFVDDDKSVRDAVARTLRRRGFIVDLAVDGEDALILAREFPYAVVATDYRMPGLSGSELVQALQAICPEATFVIVTGALEAVEGLGRMNHVHAVISKPWT